MDSDDFKDVDPSEDKFFGSELFDDLPLEERKVKFEETIQKYQSTIDMMTKLKFDLEKELESLTKVKLNSKKPAASTVHQEDQLKSQIKHLDDQIRCVLFLLMQCQIGLDNCLESTPNQAPIKITTTQVTRTPIPEIHVTFDSSDSNSS